ncbi:MAG TPA: hypothetical protein VFG30_42980 [Polyangiales bacterium]|nr:hypothetical protein [Polyangiales bacterium]
MTPIKATSSGFIEVNGFKLWHEVYGDGEPLVLLHGGLMTISEMIHLASRWRSIASWWRWSSRDTDTLQTPIGRSRWRRSATTWLP